MNKSIRYTLVIISLGLLVVGFFIEYAWPAGYLVLFIVCVEFIFTKANETGLKEPETVNTNPKTLDYIPFTIFKNGITAYENSAFEREFDTHLKPNYEKLLSAIDYRLDKQRIQHNGKIYFIRAFDLHDGMNSRILYFFEDENDAALPALTPSEVAVGLIFVDNYEEAMDTVEDSSKPMALALIDRAINNFAQSVDGIVKKFEKDRYILIFDTKKLSDVRESQFSVLKDVKNISMSNKMPFTLCIGVGINGATLRQGMEYARAAIDLAQGRGGDQALIKDGETYEFFGGHTKDVEINSSVRARVKAYALTEIIMESDSVMVMGHRNADLDCLGAGIGVYKIVKSLGKECNIILNNTTSNINGMYQKIIDTGEYKEVFITSEQAISLTRSNTLLIIVDTHRPSIMECITMVDIVNKIVVFDHHRKGTEFVEEPVLAYHETYASSTCELIVEIMRYMNQKVLLTPVEADAMLAGITVDTKNFVIKTGTKTFEAAAFLKRAGADTIRVRMVMQNDMESYKAKAMAVNTATTFMDNIAMAFCPPYVENPQLTNAQIADDLLNISGIEAAFSLYFDHAAEKVHISARSLGNINVQVIMEKMGGGGHQTASGAQVVNEDVDEVVEQLEECIKKHMKKLQ